MASKAVAAGDVGAHGQLVAGTTDTIRFTGRDLDSVEIGTDGVVEVWASVDGHDPVTDGTDQAAYRLPATSSGWAYVRVSVPTAGDTVVKLKSTGTPKYDVNA